MFKNAAIFRVEPGFRFDASILERNRFQDCGPTDQQSSGFIEPCDHSSAMLIHSVAGHQLLCYQSENKLLPGSVVDEIVKERLDAIEEREGYRPGRKQTRKIKEEVICDLLPKAFTQKRRTLALLAGDYFIVDTSSAARADAVVESVKLALDMIPFKLINTNSSPMSAMSVWLASELPDDLTLGCDATLEKSAADRPQMRYVRTDLTADAQDKIAEGWRPIKLALTFDDRLSFNLSADLHLTRIAMSDVSNEQSSDDKDAQSIFDAGIVLTAGEISKALDYLIEQFGGVHQPDDLLKEAA